MKRVRKVASFNGLEIYIDPSKCVSRKPDFDSAKANGASEDKGNQKKHSGSSNIVNTMNITKGD